MTETLFDPAPAAAVREPSQPGPSGGRRVLCSTCSRTFGVSGHGQPHVACTTVRDVAGVERCGCWCAEVDFPAEWRPVERCHACLDRPIDPAVGAWIDAARDWVRSTWPPAAVDLWGEDNLRDGPRRDAIDEIVPTHGHRRLCAPCFAERREALALEHEFGYHPGWRGDQSVISALAAENRRDGFGTQRLVTVLARAADAVFVPPGGETHFAGVARRRTVSALLAGDERDLWPHLPAGEPTYDETHGYVRASVLTETCGWCEHGVHDRCPTTTVGDLHRLANVDAKYVVRGTWRCDCACTGARPPVPAPAEQTALF